MVDDIGPDLTLEDVEGVRWGEPEFDSSLVRRCHELRRIPMRSFTVEDLRLLIGQKIGLSVLLPLALERLERDPLAEGDRYAGDLLAAVLRVNSDFWRRHPDLHTRLEGVVLRLTAEQREEVRPSLDAFESG
jgi:hypothetical protein